jgi:hypothetical protein
MCLLIFCSAMAVAGTTTYIDTRPHQVVAVRRL